MLLLKVKLSHAPSRAVAAADERPDTRGEPGPGSGVRALASAGSSCLPVVCELCRKLITVASALRNSYLLA